MVGGHCPYRVLVNFTIRWLSTQRLKRAEDGIRTRDPLLGKLRSDPHGWVQRIPQRVSEQVESQCDEHDSYATAGEALAQAFDSLGWHWWVPDMAINSQPYGEGRGPCNLCGPCDLDCPRGARASADITYKPAFPEIGRIVTGSGQAPRRRPLTVEADG